MLKKRIMTKNNPSRPPRKRRARKKNHYFTQEHEDAIVRYSATNCIRERTELYKNWIQPAFDEMVDKIVFTYKFTDLPNITQLRDECKIWLMTILDKYDKKGVSEKLIMTILLSITKSNISRQTIPT